MLKIKTKIKTASFLKWNAMRIPKSVFMEKIE